MRVGAVPHKASSRSSDSDRCAPRLLAATACSSSTMTLRTVRSMLRPPSELSRMNSDSGVVTRMCGRTFFIRARSNAEVSPVRTAVRIASSPSPSSRTRRAMPSSGASRFLRMSFDSAFSGEM